MKQRITTLRASEFKSDKAGNLIAPDGWELYKVPTKQERIQAEIARLEKELEGMKEPTRKELVEEGISVSNWHIINLEIERLKEEFNLSDPDILISDGMLANCYDGDYGFALWRDDDGELKIDIGIGGNQVKGK